MTVGGLDLAHQPNRGDQHERKINLHGTIHRLCGNNLNVGGVHMRHLLVLFVCMAFVMVVW